MRRDIPHVVYFPAAFRHRFLATAAAWSALILVAVLAVGTTTAHAASASLEGLINKLPDPDRLAKSPLETAIASQDPIFKDPEFLRFARSAKKDPNAALKALRVLTTKYPDKVALQFIRGAYALAVRQLPEAETCFRAVIKAGGPGATLGWYGVAGVQAAGQHINETAAALQQSVKLQPKFALGWMFLANIEARRGRPADGVNAARHVTQLQPRFAPGWAVLGYCEAKQKQYDAAIADYRHATSLARNYEFAYRGLGICSALTNRPADAVTPLKNALALAPNDYLVAVELGYCYLRAGQYDDGAKACREAIRVHSSFGKAWDLLGLCYRHEGKTKESLYAFQRAVKEEPNDPLYRTHLAEAGKPVAKQR